MLVHHLLAAVSAAAGLDTATLSAAWSALNDDFGAPVGANNEDRTVSWSVGGARNFSCNYAGIGTLKYRINSGSWTTYAGAFSLSSGDTLAWQYIASADESGNFQPYDATKGANLGGVVTYSSTGWP